MLKYQSLIIFDLLLFMFINKKKSEESKLYPEVDSYRLELFKIFLK